MERKAAGELNRGQEGRLLALLIGLIPLVAIGLGTRRWLPALASEHGAGIDAMIRYLFITVGSLFVLAHIVFAYFVWRFSRAGHVTYRLASPRVERRLSFILVVLMTLIAEGGTFALGLPVWQKFYAATAPPEAVTVEVTGEQFAWNIRYPGKDGVFGRTNPHLISLDNPLGLDKNDPASRDDLVFLGVLRLPVNRPALIHLRSKDTIHSFFLPNLRVKQDAVPGMTIDIWFVPTALGTYEIACAQLCGYGHFQMRGLLKVMPPEEFEKWFREESASF